MFEELKPDSEAFESFRRFCIKTAIEACHPGKKEFYYNILNHPIHPEKNLMLIYDKSHRDRFYLVEMKEGRPVSLDHPEEEAFYFWNVEKPIFPATAVIAGDEVTLSYTPNPDIPEATECGITSREKYELLKGLFDEENPAPWKEFQNLKGGPSGWLQRKAVISETWLQ